MPERRAQWSFLIAENDSWYWQVIWPDAKTMRSATNFQTLTECVSDAKQQGYVVYLENGQRRASHQPDPTATVVGVEGAATRARKR